VIASARAADVRVVFVPHRRWERGYYESSDHPSPTRRSIMERHTFARGTWAGSSTPTSSRGPVTSWPGSTGRKAFANTDLDLQLKRHGIGRVVMTGVPANTCVESTSRFAVEIGYHVTLVCDAIAAFLPEMMHAAHELNGPTCAHAVVTTDRLVTAFDAAGPRA
jgi:hypothetical protein